MKKKRISKDTFCETAEIVHLTIVKVGVKYSKHVYFNILEGVNFDLNL